MTETTDETWSGAAELRSFLVALDDLTPDPRNPRRGDVEAVARSLDAFGQRKPIVVRKGRGKRPTIIAGNQTYAAARSLGWTHLAVVDASDLDPKAAQAFALADNRTSDLATYDDEVLADVLREVDEYLDATGYTAEDLDDLLADLADTIHASAEHGQVLEDGRTVKDREDSYRDSSVRAIIIPVPTARYESVVRMLSELRERFDVETNAEVILRLLDEATST